MCCYNQHEIKKERPENLYYHPQSKWVAKFIGKGTYIEGIVNGSFFKSQDDLKLKASDFTVEDNYNYGVLIFPENLSLTDNNKKLESLIKTILFTGKRYQYTYFKIWS